MTPVVDMSGVVKNYSGLRPLRIESLSVAESERVAIAGIDAAGAEVLVNLLTGASLPDAGEVRVFGRIDYIDVWNAERFAQKLDRESWTDADALLLSEHGI